MSAMLATFVDTPPQTKRVATPLDPLPLTNFRALTPQKLFQEFRELHRLWENIANSLADDRPETEALSRFFEFYGAFNAKIEATKANRQKPASKLVAEGMKEETLLGALSETAGGLKNAIDIFTHDIETVWTGLSALIQTVKSEFEENPTHSLALLSRFKPRINQRIQAMYVYSASATIHNENGCLDISASKNPISMDILFTALAGIEVRSRLSVTVDSSVVSVPVGIAYCAMQLATNACKHDPADGLQRANKIQVKVGKDKHGSICLSVSDDGPGFRDRDGKPLDSLAQAFVRGYTTKPGGEDGSHGNGLAFIKGIVDRGSYEMAVFSKADKRLLTFPEAIPAHQVLSSVEQGAVFFIRTPPQPAWTRSLTRLVMPGKGPTKNEYVVDYGYAKTRTGFFEPGTAEAKPRNGFHTTVMLALRFAAVYCGILRP